MRDGGSSRRSRYSASGMIFSIALFLSVISLPFLSGLLPIVRFTEERIDITVYPDHVRVRGIYVYNNLLPFQVIQGLTVPLPIDRDNPAPIMLRVTELKPEYERIPVRCLMKAHRCEVAAPARGSVTVMVEYIQYAPGENAHYLLTTTRPWRRPIERGVFRLIPEDVEIIYSNYPLVPVDAGALIFQREEFMPTVDWKFSWEVTDREEK